VGFHVPMTREPIEDDPPDDTTPIPPKTEPTEWVHPDPIPKPRRTKPAVPQPPARVEGEGSSNDEDDYCSSTSTASDTESEEETVILAVAATQTLQPSASQAKLTPVSSPSKKKVIRKVRTPVTSPKLSSDEENPAGLSPPKRVRKFKARPRRSLSPIAGSAQNMEISVASEVCSPGALEHSEKALSDNDTSILSAGGTLDLISPQRASQHSLLDSSPDGKPTELTAAPQAISVTVPHPEAQVSVPEASAKGDTPLRAATSSVPTSPPGLGKYPLL
jgi:hypothetical protein